MWAGMMSNHTGDRIIWQMFFLSLTCFIVSSVGLSFCKSHPTYRKSFGQTPPLLLPLLNATTDDAAARLLEPTRHPFHRSELTATFTAHLPFSFHRWELLGPCTNSTLLLLPLLWATGSLNHEPVPFNNPPLPTRRLNRPPPILLHFSEPTGAWTASHLPFKLRVNVCFRSILHRPPTILSWKINIQINIYRDLLYLVFTEK